VGPISAARSSSAGVDLHRCNAGSLSALTRRPQRQGPLARAARRRSSGDANNLLVRRQRPSVRGDSGRRTCIFGDQAGRLSLCVRAAEGAALAMRRMAASASFDAPHCPSPCRYALGERPVSRRNARANDAVFAKPQRKATSLVSKDRSLRRSFARNIS